MSIKEQQDEEIEALRSIFDSSFHGITSIPPSFMIQLDEAITGDIPGPFYLKFTMCELYPDVLPTIQVISKHIHVACQDDLKLHLRQVGNDLLGEPMIFTLVDAAKEWILNNSIKLVQEEESNKENEDHGAETEEYNEDELEAESSAPSGPRKGGLWKFVVGLVGKPSAGKSTFFNAATCTTRAKVAAHPFTTIDPNIDTAYCTTKCPCANWENRCDAEYDHARSGERNIPVLIKDVAGLVPGAADGKGKGNRFLNDLCDADVLIHIVDASGNTNENGEQTTGYDPMLDIHWLPNEIYRWIYDNIMSKWDSVLRKPNKLVDMFSGYHASQSLIHQAFQNAAISLRTLKEDIYHWDCDVTLSRLVKEFMRLRFPIVVALNKADLKESWENIDRIQSEVGADRALPVSAESECFLQVMHQLGKVEIFGNEEIKLTTEDSCGKTHESFVRYQSAVFQRYGLDCVLRVLNTAVASRRPVYSFPVTSLETMKSISVTRSDKGAVLKHCVMLKPGSTVLDLYEMLLYALKLLYGKYVRAEGLHFTGGNKHILKKETLIDDTNCIINIMTSKRH